MRKIQILSVCGGKTARQVGCFFFRGEMQDCFHIEITAAQYIEEQRHKTVEPPPRCLVCAHDVLHRHGSYARDVVEAGRPWAIRVARFLCARCFRTTSRLPSLALPYRLIGTAAVEAFLQEGPSEPQTGSHHELLRFYGRRWQERATEIARVVGNFFCFSSQEPASDALLKGMLAQHGGLERASVYLLDTFGESPLGRYRVHDWARVARGSVDPLRKPAYLDSG